MESEQLDILKDLQIHTGTASWSSIDSKAPSQEPKEDQPRTRRESPKMANEKPSFPSEERCKKSDVECVKGPWTDEEDALLRSLVALHGPQNWSKTIAEKVAGRNGKQCRERWYNNLDPSIRKDAWSPEEDEILCKAHAELGNRWADISLLLPGRPSNSVKNHWHTTLKRREVSKRKTDPDSSPASFGLEKRAKRLPSNAVAVPSKSDAKRQKLHKDSDSSYSGESKLGVFAPAPRGSESTSPGKLVLLPINVVCEPDPPDFINGVVNVRLTEEEQLEWLQDTRSSRNTFDADESDFVPSYLHSMLTSGGEPNAGFFLFEEISM